VAKYYLYMESTGIKPIETIAKGSAVVFVGMVFGYVLNFIFKMMLARHYGPHGYGLVSMGLALMVISSNIATMGLNVGIARFVAVFEGQKEYGKLQMAIRSGAKITGLLGVCLAAAVFLLAPKLSYWLGDNGNLTLLIYCFALVIPFSVASNYSLGVLRGFKAMKAMVVCDNIVNWVARILILATIIVLSTSIKYVPFTYFFSFLVTLALSWIYIRMNNVFCNRESKNKYEPFYGELLSFCLPLFLSTVMIMFRSRFDILLVGFFLPSVQVGLYNAAAPIAMLLSMFMFAINRILMPAVSELLGQNSQKEIDLIYKTITRWTVLITVPIFFIILFFGDIILNSFFGAEYVKASSALRILATGFVLKAMSGASGEYLQSYGKTKQVLWITSIGTSVNILSMILLVPEYGIIGAAFSMTLSMICMSVFGIWFLYKHTSILPFSKRYFKTIIIGCFTFLNLSWLYLLPINMRNFIAVLSIILFFTIIYFFLLSFFRAFSDIDREIYNVFFRRLSKTVLKVQEMF